MLPRGWRLKAFLRGRWRRRVPHPALHSGPSAQKARASKLEPPNFGHFGTLVSRIGTSARSPCNHVLVAVSHPCPHASSRRFGSKPRPSQDTTTACSQPASSHKPIGNTIEAHCRRHGAGRAEGHVPLAGGFVAFLLVSGMAAEMVLGKDGIMELAESFGLGDVRAMARAGELPL